jgi:hypothetical protein
LRSPRCHCRAARLRNAGDLRVTDAHQPSVSLTRRSKHGRLGGGLGVEGRHAIFQVLVRDKGKRRFKRIAATTGRHRCTAAANPRHTHRNFYTALMRMTDAERLAIEAGSREVLPAGTRVGLFGSRTDDTRRGGDIELLL